MVSTLKAIRENGSTFLNSYFKCISELRTKEICTFGSDFHRHDPLRSSHATFSKVSILIFNHKETAFSFTHILT